MIRSFVLAAAACAALAGAARAEQQIAVSTKGLDLSIPAGAKVFYSRLSHAVIAACGGAPTNGVLDYWKRSRIPPDFYGDADGPPLCKALPAKPG